MRGPLPSLLILISAGAHAAPWPHGDDATGDWGGGRTWLGDHGVRLDLDYTADIAARLSGHRVLRYRGNVDLMLSLDTKKLGLWPGGLIFAYGQNGHGEGVSDAIAARLLVSNLEAPDFTQLSELWLEQHFGERVRVRIGKQDANRDFGGPRFTGNFVNSSYGVIPTMPEPSFPTPGVGAAAAVHAADWLEVRAGAYEGAPRLEALGGQGFDDGVFAVASVILKHDLQGRPSGLHTLGAWHHTGQERSGLFAVADIRLFVSQDEDDPRSIQLFARAGWVPDDPDAAHVYVGGGATAHAFLGSNNTIGAGAGHARFAAGDETFVELFFKLRPYPWLTIEPDLQVYRTARGTDTFSILRGKIKL